MTHLDLENLATEYLEGQLEATRKAEVEAHLAACVPCRELIADVRQVLELCHRAESLEAPAWIIPHILEATVGARKPTWKEELAALLRLALQPKFAYTVAMAVFSFSILVNTAGINLRSLKLKDLSPRTLAYRATRTGYLLCGRAEKFYYDLRVVYEIESRLRQMQRQPSGPERESPKPESAPGGTTDNQPPGNPRMASKGGGARPRTDLDRTPSKLAGTASDQLRAGRNSS